MSRLVVTSICVLAVAAHLARDLSGAKASGVELRAGTCRLSVDVADTPSRRATGLSHTAARIGDGLLLRWPRPGLHAIWMADMTYPLDLAWIDNEHIVRAVLTHVPPCTAAPCPIYAPPGAANSVAVLETGAGRLAACEVRAGQAISFASAERSAR